jgi:hypothetical protein
MPVEIKELHIKAIVGSRAETKQTGIAKEDISRLKREITREVIEKVFKVIKQKNER